jgi:cytosine/adenosine deaminase-related metal-dependent hydrolase
VPELLEAGIAVYLGADNIYDLFMPFTDGDMWFEARMLMEACRFYDIDAVARMACRRPACGLMLRAGSLLDRVGDETSRKLYEQPSVEASVRND